MNVLEMLEARRAECFVARTALIDQMEKVAVDAIEVSRGLNTEELAAIDTVRADLATLEAELD